MPELRRRIGGIRTTACLLLGALALGACDEEAAAEEEEAWTLSFLASTDSVDLGYVTYEDELPSAGVTLTNDSGVSLLLRSVELVGYGSDVVLMSGVPGANSALGMGGSLNLSFQATDEVDWQTGWYTPELVITAANDESADGDQDDQTWSLGVLFKVRCDLDGDGYDAEICGGTDCDDDDADVNIGAADVCNEQDDDCDGTVDESPDTVWYPDSDGDGYGVDGETEVSCEQPSGLVDNADDCDDEDASVHPDADEYCNKADDNCNGEIDEEPTVDPLTWYQDADGDGWGSDEVTTDACIQPKGYLADSGDCNDADGNIHPELGEICDKEDQDCDGEIDENPVAEGDDYYADVDGDGFGDATSATYACSLPKGYVEDDSDCDDSDAGTHPDAVDDCGVAADGVDNDCDGVADNTDDALTYYADDDGDGYGDSSSTEVACAGVPSGYTQDASDCDDDDSAVNPGASEVCGDELDNDCDDLLDCDDGDCDGNLPCSLDLANADAVLVGEAAGDLAGYAVAAAGFVDGDGFADILVSSPSEDSNGADAGAAYLLLGPVSGTVDLSAADAKLMGEAASDQAGIGLSWAGDFDGDGYDDLLVGGPQNDANGSASGSAYVLFGPVSGTSDLASADLVMVGAAAGDEAGTCVAGVGDTDGDGLDDVLIGAPYYDTAATDVGGAHLLLGGVDGSLLLFNDDATLQGESADDYAGGGLAGAGDVDGDGYDDMLVGAEGKTATATDAGIVYLVLGPQAGDVSLSTATARIVGLGTDDGLHLAATGDLDGDGVTDYLLGAEGDDTSATSAGAVYALLGPVSGSVNVSAADDVLYGASASTAAGASLAVVPDIDGDGTDEILVGAWGATFGSATAGAAYLEGWPWTGPLLDDGGIPMGGSTTDDRAGWSVSCAGDVDDDGVEDILIGAPYEDSGGSAAGAAYLVLGSNFQ